MTNKVEIGVELFGTARLACGQRRLDVRVPSNAHVSDVVTAIAAACPALIGVALRDDLSGLLESYTLNLNAVAFIADGELTLRSGDLLLLFSSQAGG